MNQSDAFICGLKVNKNVDTEQLLSRCVTANPEDQQREWKRSLGTTRKKSETNLAEIKTGVRPLCKA